MKPRSCSTCSFQILSVAAVIFDSMPPILVVELAEMDLVGLLQPPKEEGRIRPQGPTCEGLACKRLRSQGAFDLFFIELAKLGPDLIADLPENRYDMLIA